jgi:hypothetical protein
MYFVYILKHNFYRKLLMKGGRRELTWNVISALPIPEVVNKLHGLHIDKHKACLSFRILSCFWYWAHMLRERLREYRTSKVT